MKTSFTLIILLISQLTLAIEVEDGPSTLESEFLKRASVYLPINYSAINGLSFEYTVAKDEADVVEDDLFGDITGLTVNVSPLVNGNYEKTKRLISLEEGALNSLDIEEANPDSPFLLIENKKWDLSLGTEAYAFLPMPIFVAGVAVSKLKGKHYYSIMRLKNKFEKRASLAFPTSQRNLRTWEVGDQIFYATRGGIVLNAFLGFKPLMSIGPEYVHTGSYRIKAHLIAKDVMEIEITTTKTDTLAFEAASIPAKFETSKGKGGMNAIIYHFDLNHPDATRGMAYMFEGRFDLTNKLMLNSGGKIKLTTKMQNSYVSVSGKYGLPFLFSSGGGMGFSQSNGEIEKEEEGKVVKLEVFSSANSREFFTRGLVANRKWFSQNVASTVLRDRVNSAESSITANYSWSFTKDKMSERVLRNKLAKLTAIFGSDHLDNLTFPSSKLGYLKADLGINFTGKDVLYLLNTSNLRHIQSSALAKLEKDFVLYGHRAFCKMRAYSDCLNRYFAGIEAKFEELRELVVTLNLAYSEDRIADVTRCLSKIITQLLQSKYLTEAYVKSRPELLLELRLEGSNIKKHIIKL